ncbi:hypothetical protein GCM10023224_27840 [Streptomonospora halophila]|uniref:ABC-type transport system involved in multi-copper enzyme maturation, permease component n=1 Tax=Streptomonospora halophila TaxID=427369 RepID=A0ABP9GHL7_9ACTN
MIESFTAEAVKLGKRPAVWTVVGAWVVLSLVFGYVFPYANAETGSGGTGSDGPDPTAGDLAGALPAELVPTAIGGYPMFAGALALIVGVLAVGGEYGWDTMKALLTMGPRRESVMAGKLAALVALLLPVVLLAFGADASASLLVAAFTDNPAQWPPADEVLTGVGAAWLMVSMWALAGAFLATLVRGTALAVGLGVVWALAVENLLRLFGSSLEAVEAVQSYLPGTTAGSLAASLGVEPGSTPGVTDAVDGGTAILVLVGYVVVFAGASILLVRRRDVA